MGFRKSVLIAAAFYFVNVVCDEQHEKRIKNGTDVDITQAQFYGFLIINNTYYCGATILTRNRVVTSAQCVYSYRVNDLAVAVGLNSQTEVNSTTRYNASKITIHPKFDVTNPLFYDIAVINTRANIKLGPRVSTISYSNAPPPVNSIVQIYGYGYTALIATPRKLQTTKNTVIVNFSTLTITKAETTSAFPGDEGGPVVYKGKLVGVISGFTYEGNIFNTKLNLHTTIGNPEIYSFVKNAVG